MLLGYEILPRNPLLRRVSAVTGESAAVDTRRRSDLSERRRRALLRVDRELHKGNYKNAVSMVKQLQGQPGGLRGFGAAEQIPKKVASMEDPKLNGIDLSYLEPMVDAVLDSIQSYIEFASMEDLHFQAPKLEEGTDPLSEEEILMIARHEAGHFLVAYLLGVLPKQYKLVRNRTPGQDQFAGGKVTFVGFGFLTQTPPDSENRKGHVSLKVLNNYSCILLGGLVVEHLSSGFSEGLHGDINKLQKVIKWVGMTQMEARLHVKWATMNTIFILNQHQDRVSRLTEAMASGRSISSCINAIEDSL